MATIIPYELIMVGEDFSGITEYVEINVFESIAVIERFSDPIYSLSVYEEISVTDIFSKISKYGHQMPTSKPQGSLRFDYQEGGSVMPQTSFEIGGGL
jgi:hypothetical protein